MKCKLCSKKTEHLELHHIIPKSRGGSNDANNLIKLCSKCHGLAHNVSFVDDRGGLIKESCDRIKKQNKLDKKWLDENKKIVHKKIMKLYYEDEDEHMFMLLLLEKGRFTPSHIRKWFEDGRVTFKTSITFS
jgi:hypothetical protein